MFLKSMLPRSVRAASQVARRSAGLHVQKRGMAQVPIHPGPTGPDKRLVLAYSGGLDTSTQLRWLADKGYEVIAFCANLGQGGGMNDEDFSGIEAKALASGAKKCYVLDLQEDFVENYVFPIIRANALYESRYLLGTSLARPCITKTLVSFYSLAVVGSAAFRFCSELRTGRATKKLGITYHTLICKPFSFLV